LPISIAVEFHDFLAAPSLKMPRAVRDVMANQKFVVGLDFGTTFTSVSYHIVSGAGRRRALPNEIMTIKNWPSDGVTGDRTQVPTELVSSYP
jgi:hypothetical protein